MSIQEAIHILKDNNHQVTRQRKAIVSYFANEDGYRSAKALLAHLNTTDDKISVDTLYRNLYLYVDLNILETTDLDGEQYFRIACSPHHHHHFICQTCGKTKKITVCPMDELGSSLDGYHVADHKFEIYGLCPLCQTKVQ